MSRNRVRSRARALSIFSDSAINLNFIPIAGTSPSLDPRITFTRSTTGTYTNSAGVISSAAINAPRFDYDPVTLEPKGLLIEEQRTNTIRNNTMQGVVVGTPGTLPTNWQKAENSSLSFAVVGTGTEDGIAYIDIRFSGTSSGTVGSSIQFEQNSQIVAAVGQTWALTSYAKIIGGSMAGISTIRIGWEERSTSFLASNFSTAPLQTGGKLAIGRITHVGTNGNASTTSIKPYIFFSPTNGAAIDITLRIGLPQLELGAFATSVIPTAGAAATRTADLASVTGTNFSSWYNQTEGTIYLEAQCLAAIAAQTYLAIDNGTSNNLITVRTSPSSATFERAQIVDGGVTQVTLEAGGYTATSINNFGFAYKVNDFARSINGSSVLTDTSGTVPTVNQLFIGSERGQYFVNGHICRIVYYPTRLSNEKLRALTS